MSNEEKKEENKPQENIMDRINRLEQIVIQQQQQIKALNDELIALGKTQKELVDVLKAMQTQSQSQSQTQQPSIDPELLKKLGIQDLSTAIGLAMIREIFGGGGGELSGVLKVAKMFFDTYNRGMKDSFRLLALLGSDKRKKLLDELFKEEEEEEESEK
jgi:uncharacterized coiled-coil protein SlyX